MGAEHALTPDSMLVHPAGQESCSYFLTTKISSIFDQSLKLLVLNSFLHSFFFSSNSCMLAVGMLQLSIAVNWLIEAADCFAVNSRSLEQVMNTADPCTRKGLKEQTGKLRAVLLAQAGSVCLQQASGEQQKPPRILKRHLFLRAQWNMIGRCFANSGCSI